MKKYNLKDYIVVSIRLTMGKFVFLTITILFFSFLLYSTFCNVQILKYDVPGTYLLTPLEYSYSDNIIIQMWGGGSGGSTIIKNNINKNFSYLYQYQYQYQYTGGSSGSYIAANIITFNETFTLTVGAGGLSCLSGFEPEKLYYCQGIPGSNSVIEGNNFNVSTNNFVLYYKYGVYPYETFANDNNKIILDEKYGFIIDYYNSSKGDTIIVDRWTNNTVKGVIASNSNRNGAGTGADCCFVPANNGNNGVILVYFDSFLSPTITMTRTSSVTPSKTKTYTPSPSISLPQKTFSIIFEDHCGEKNKFLCLFEYGILIILCGVCILLTSEEFYKYISKRISKKYFNNYGSCNICLDEKSKIMKCNFGHGICEECYDQIDPRFKIKIECPICGNAYLTI